MVTHLRLGFFFALAACGGINGAVVPEPDAAAVGHDASEPPRDAAADDSSRPDSSPSSDAGPLDSAVPDATRDAASDAGSSACARACALAHTGGCSEFMLVGYQCAAPCGSGSLNDLCNNPAPAGSEVACVKNAIAACKDAGGGNPFPQCSNTCSGYIPCLEACP